FALRGEVWLQCGEEPSPPVADVPLGCLSPARPILWHKGSDIEPTLPWWPDAGCLAAIAAVQRGAQLHPDMWPSAEVLADQGILVRRSLEPGGGVDRELGFDAGRASFASERFVDLGQVLPP